MMREFSHKIVELPIDSVRVSPHSARSHSRAQLTKLRKSIGHFGFLVPVLVDESNTLITGHARLKAALSLGYQYIPAIPIAHLSEAEIRAYQLADNKLCELGEWDKAKLRAELEFLTEIDLDFDLELTGFEMAEIDVLLSEQNIAEEVAIPDPPEANETLCEPGDIWQLGPHRIVCGDSCDLKTIERLMAGKAAQMQISDPPYNVPTAGHISTSDSAGHGNFAMAAGEMSCAEFTDFLITTQSTLSSACNAGSLHYIFMDWRHLVEITEAVQTVYDELINVCVWSKTNGGMGSFYRSAHELIFVALKGKGPHINNIQLGAYGRYKTNVWEHGGMNTFGSDRDDCLSVHPTVKPTQMIADAIMDATHRGNIVLDGFLGSGTTLLAAEISGRVGYGVEYEPRYVDVAIQRWQTLTGKQAVNALSGHTFNDLAAARDEAGLLQEVSDE